MDGRKKLRGSGLLLVLVLISGTLYSQENYIPGYIIKNNSDKEEGYIDYRQWEKNPDFVEFKYELANAPVRLSTEDILEFGAADDVYIRAIVDTEITPTDVNKLEYGSELWIEVDTVFLQTLFSGDKELYYFNSRKGKENFYIRQGDKIALLKYKEYLKRTVEKGVISVKNNSYLGQLILYLNDCPSIQARIKNTDYRKRDIENLFRYYYKCTNPELAASMEREKLKPEFGLLAGASLTNSTYAYYEYVTLSETAVDHSLNFTGGVFLDLVSQRGQQKWSLNNELIISSHSFNGESRDEMNSTTRRPDLAFTFLKLNSLARFKYPIGQAYWYLNGGFSAGYLINKKNHEVIESDAGVTIYDGTAFLTQRKLSVGYLLGTGIKFKDYSFEVRAEKKSIKTDQYPPDVKTMQYYFLLGYRF